MVEVIGSEEFEKWFLELQDPDAEAVARVIGILEIKGTTLDFPYSSAIQGTTFALRELRIQSQGKPLRVFYAFDPKRQAVLLIGGDKTGDKRFYEKMIRLSEQIWQKYLIEMEES
jgi:hypothetical protein